MLHHAIATFIAALLGLFAAGAWAQQHELSEQEFVEANLLGIFYHELGHAVIHLESVPIFGQEEDAADVFSIFLIDQLYEEDTANILATDIAIGLWAEAEHRDEMDEEIAWWDVHGPDEQRFFNSVCLFYGADPESRELFAIDMELPDERIETCAEEFDQANASWGPILDEVFSRKDGFAPTLQADDTTLTAELLQEEVEALAKEFRLSRPLTIVVEECGEANAFYDLDAIQIIMCTEFEAHLQELAKFR